MKRPSKTSTRAMRHARNGVAQDGKHNSAYAAKVRSRDQMYGPNCCAHSLTSGEMRSIRMANGTWRE